MFYRITPEQVESYSEVYHRFAGLFECAVDRERRTPNVMVAKKQARNLHEKAARRLAAQVRSQTHLSPEEKFELGLHPQRKKPARTPRPAAAPVVTVLDVDGQRVRVRLQDAECLTRKGRPMDVESATLFYAVGAQMPQSPSEWHMVAQTSQCKCDIVVPSDLSPGTKIWITAGWLNRRQEPSPLARPVWTNLGYVGIDLARGGGKAA